MFRTVIPILLLTIPLTAAEIRFSSGDRRVSLIELYTSEGCSSCPRADAWLSGLKTKPALWKDFVPLAFHVDYWDGLGWPDRFARPGWTERQRAYARHWQSRSVYTPGFVINGKEWRGFFRRESLPPRSKETPGNLRLRTTDRKTWHITFTPSETSGETLILHVARLTTDKTTKVTAGENRDRRLHHDFIVLDLTSVPLIQSAIIKLSPLPKNHPPTALAAWLTTPTDPIPIQSTGGWLGISSR